MKGDGEIIWAGQKGFSPRPAAGSYKVLLSAAQPPKPNPEYDALVDERYLQFIEREIMQLSDEEWERVKRCREGGE